MVLCCRKNLADLDSLKAGLLRRVEPDWTTLLSVQTNHTVQNNPPSADRSGCSSRSGQVRSRSPLTVTGRCQTNGQGAPQHDTKPSRSRVDSRTYTSLTNGSPRKSSSAATSIADKENHSLAGSPPRVQRSGDPAAESLVFVRAMNDVSSGDFASGVFCHRREVRGGPTDGSRVMASAPAAVGRLFSDQETAELRRYGSGALGAGGGELPSSVVELIETAVRRSAEVPEPPPASSDSDSLPFGENLRSLNDTSESERGAPSAPSHAELFISILQEMEARDGGASVGRDTHQTPDETAAALGAILARDMSRLRTDSGAPSSGSYNTAPEPPDSGRSEAALETLEGDASRGTGDEQPPESDPEPELGLSGRGGESVPPSWREEPAGDGRRSARRCRLAAALDMR